MSYYKNLTMDSHLNMPVLEEMYQRAVNIQMGLESHTIHPKGSLRFGASDSLCPRLAFLKGIRPHLLPEYEIPTLRKFRVGDLFHKMADEGIEKVLWEEEGHIVKLNSFRLRAFPDLFEGLFPDCVSGTPDHVLIVPEHKMLILVDQKSANDFGFAKNKKHGASIYHSVQVGTYLDGLQRSPIGNWIEFASMYICYMSKESVEVSIQRISKDYLDVARQYWSLVAEALKNTQADGKDGELPPALPREEWACGYCPFFSDERTYKKKERAMELCQGCKSLNDFDVFMNPPALIAGEEVKLIEAEFEELPGE